MQTRAANNTAEIFTVSLLEKLKAQSVELRGKPMLCGIAPCADITERTGSLPVMVRPTDVGRSPEIRWAEKSDFATVPTFLCRGVLLACCFYPFHYPDSQKHNRACGDPVRGHMHQVGGINQAADHDRKSD